MNDGNIAYGFECFLRGCSFYNSFFKFSLFLVYVYRAIDPACNCFRTKKDIFSHLLQILRISSHFPRSGSSSKFVGGGRSLRANGMSWKVLGIFFVFVRFHKYTRQTKIFRKCFKRYCARNMKQG